MTIAYLIVANHSQRFYLHFGKESVTRRAWRPVEKSKDQKRSCEGEYQEARPDGRSGLTDDDAVTELLLQRKRGNYNRIHRTMRSTISGGPAPSSRGHFATVLPYSGIAACSFDARRGLMEHHDLVCL